MPTRWSTWQPVIPPLAPGAWHTNDRLRTRATRNLVDAAIAAGVEVFVQESVSSTTPTVARGGWMSPPR
jgi:hypothetical protein